jgi:adenosylcobinamide-phosphate synthase
MINLLLSLSVAVIIDLVAGDLPNRYHPVVAMGKFIHWADELCRVRSHTLQFIYGFFLTLLGGVIFTLPWWFFSGWITFLPAWMRIILFGLLLKPVFAFRSLIAAGWAIYRSLSTGDLIEARRLTGWHLVSRRTDTLSTGQVASAVVESLAENLTDSIIAPIFFFLLGGLPAAWFYRFVNTADAMIGYHTERYEFSGKFTARLDDMLNWLPARLAALCIVASAGICRMDIRQAWKTMVDQHHLTSSPNAGWTMAAAAGALNVRLEKIGCYLLNAEKSLPAAKDIQRTSRLVETAALLGIFMMEGIGFGISCIF